MAEPHTAWNAHYLPCWGWASKTDPPPTVPLQNLLLWHNFRSGEKLQDQYKNRYTPSSHLPSDLRMNYTDFSFSPNISMCFSINKAELFSYMANAHWTKQNFSMLSVQMPPAVLMSFTDRRDLPRSVYLSWGQTALLLCAPHFGLGRCFLMLGVRVPLLEKVSKHCIRGTSMDWTLLGLLT